MRGNQDDDMLPEYDWSGAVRGRYADRFTPAMREELRRRGLSAMVEELSAYTLRQVQELESALFAFFVLAGQQSVQQAAKAAIALLEPSGSAVAEMAARGLPDQGLAADLHAVAGQRQWIQHPVPADERDSDSLKPVVERLEIIYSQVRSLRERVEALIEGHLARAGLSAGEIERRTEETAKLWLAA